jgi:uroporphyrin-III C-methyltransferase
MSDAVKPPEALPYLPVFMDLTGRPCLVLGSGEAAANKAALLHRASAKVHQLSTADFTTADLDNVALVVDATEDDAFTRSLATLTRMRGIPLNVVDKPDLCDFIFPAILDRSPVIVAVSTGGLAPALARLIRQRLESAIPAAFGRLAHLAGEFRRKVQDALPTTRQRLRYWDEVLDGRAGDLAMHGRAAEARTEMDRLLSRTAADNTNAGPGMVHLVGAGPGDTELLTLAAIRAIKRADVILYDHLVGPGVLEFSRRDAERIPVGKRAGRHSMKQTEINALLLEHASMGRRVVRLKGGDPMMFGRAGEEAAYLRRHGIDVTIVPGVTAALGCAATSQIPLTLRGVSRSIQFVTAHCMDDDATNAMDWSKLANPDGTLAIYMGRSQLPHFSTKLIEAGLCPDTPAAIENGTLPTERRCFATLSTLAARAAAELGDGPTLVIIGHVIDHRPHETYSHEELPQSGAQPQSALRRASSPALA